MKTIAKLMLLTIGLALAGPANGQTTVKSLAKATVKNFKTFNAERFAKIHTANGTLVKPLQWTISGGTFPANRFKPEDNKPSERSSRIVLKILDFYDANTARVVFEKTCSYCEDGKTMISQDLVTLLTVRRNDQWKINFTRSRRINQSRVTRLESSETMAHPDRWAARDR